MSNDNKDTASEREAFEAAPVGELWAVHAQGPDDIYPAFSRDDAERHAAELNALPMPEGIAVSAVVIQSPLPAAEHWKCLAEQEREHCEAIQAGAAYQRAQQPQSAEAVAWLNMEKLSVGGMAYATSFKTSDKQTPLYTAPQPSAGVVMPEIGEDRSVFFGYLIDKYEGYEISEENLQGWLSEMLSDPHYCALFRREKSPEGLPSAIELSIEAAEEEHGSLRAAAKALGIDAGYLSRLKTGEKVNPSDEVLSALGLERVTYFRARLNGKEVGRG